MRTKWFVHTTPEGFDFDDARQYEQTRFSAKPSGLWCAELTADGDSDVWTEWMEAEEVESRLSTERFVVHVDLSDVLICHHPDDLGRFPLPDPEFGLRFVDWAAVTREYAGIHFADYMRGLGVMSVVVVDAVGGCVCYGGVVPVEIVVVDPGLEALAAVGF